MADESQTVGPDPSRRDSPEEEPQQGLSTYEHDSKVADARPITEGEAEQLRQEILQDLEDSDGPRGKPWYNLVAAALVAAIGVYAVLSGLGYGLGRLAEPGPGMWPFGLGALVVGIAAMIALRARRVSDTEQINSSAVYVLVGVASMIVFWILLPIVGFEIPSIILSFVWLKLLGRLSWRLTLVSTVLIVAAFYIVFILALGVPVPRII